MIIGKTSRNSYGYFTNAGRHWIRIQARIQTGYPVMALNVGGITLSYFIPMGEWKPGIRDGFGRLSDEQILGIRRLWRFCVQIATTRKTGNKKLLARIFHGKNCLCSSKYFNIKRCLCIMFEFGTRGRFWASSPSQYYIKCFWMIDGNCSGGWFQIGSSSIAVKRVKVSKAVPESRGGERKEQQWWRRQGLREAPWIFAKTCDCVPAASTDIAVTAVTRGSSE